VHSAGIRRLRHARALNYHYHVLALDGVISGDVERGVRFHEATALEAPDAEALARTVQLRVLRWFARRGLLDPSAAADMRTWRGTGGFASHLRCSVSSTAVDGSVRIEGEDRAGLERLVRYCARGPLALERLHAPAGIAALSSPEARLVYRLPEPDVHGRHELRLTPLDLLDRLARQRFALLTGSAAPHSPASLPRSPRSQRTPEIHGGHDRTVRARRFSGRRGISLLTRSRVPPRASAGPLR
jgi:hypothetical protein